MKNVILVSLILLSGCATCRREPVLCAVGATLATGAVLYAVHHTNEPAVMQPRENTQPVVCNEDCR